MNRSTASARGDEPPGTRRAGSRHARALLLLLLAVGAVLLPHVLRGEVLYPFDNRAEVGQTVETFAPGLRAYFDQALLYLPEINAHLRCPHEGHFATWNPHNELGRQVFHLTLGTAFLPFQVLAWFTDDPYVYATWLALLAVFGSAGFTFAFLRERGFGPAACFAGGLGISIGPLFPAWQVFTMVQWGFCWAFAALYATELHFRRPTLFTLGGIAFSVHAALMTGFPQHVMLLGWIVLGWLVLRSFEVPRGARARAWYGLVGAGLVGVLAALPAFADTFVDWSRSSRGEHAVSGRNQFVLAEDFVRMVESLYGAHWDGGAGELSFGLSPVFACLSLVALLGWRRPGTRYWLAWAGFLCLASSTEAASSVLRAMGLVLSAWSPIYAIALPCTILAATGVDLALQEGRRGRAGRVALAGALVLFVTATRALGVTEAERGFDWVLPLLGLGTCLFVWKPHVAVLLPLLAVVVLREGQGLAYWQVRSEILEDSALAVEVRERTSDGSRFAFVGDRPGVVRSLRPNVEITLGLRSVHTYYHLQSRAYAEAFRPLAPTAQQARKYSRAYDALGDLERVPPGFLADAGVSTLLSTDPLDPTWVEDPEHIGAFWVSTLRERGPRQALFPPGRFRLPAPERAGVARGAAGELGVEVSRSESGHDRIALAFEAQAGESLLFLSQQYHPSWKARSASGPLPTLTVNGLFQGVLVPPGVARVELAFEPWIRWAVVPQLAFGLLGLAAVVATLRAQRGVRARTPLLPTRPSGPLGSSTQNWK